MKRLPVQGIRSTHLSRVLSGALTAGWDLGRLFDRTSALFLHIQLAESSCENLPVESTLQVNLCSRDPSLGSKICDFSRCPHESVLI